MISKSEARMLAVSYNKEVNLLEASSKIASLIKNDTNYKNAKIIGLYYPMEFEINLLELLKDCSKSFAFPKIVGKRVMHFILIDNKTMWKINKFGINEPVNGKIIKEEIDLFLISSLARNKDNQRLGHGGGYYDTYFSNPSPAKKIGILVNNNLIDFKTEEYDIKLDYYITHKENKNDYWNKAW